MYLLPVVNVISIRCMRYAFHKVESFSGAVDTDRFEITYARFLRDSVYDKRHSNGLMLRCGVSAIDRYLPPAHELQQTSCTQI